MPDQANPPQVRKRPAVFQEKAAAVAKAKAEAEEKEKAAAAAAAAENDEGSDDDEPSTKKEKGLLEKLDSWAFGDGEGEDEE